MDEKNYEYLTNQVKSLGFGDNKSDEISNGLKKGLKEFQIKIDGEFKQENGKKDKVDFELHFKKSDTSEKYFLNGYDAVLKKNDERMEDISKTFVVMGFNKDFPDVKQNITSKEAYNILSGRAVLKDRIKKDIDSGVSTQYLAWQYLDFSQKDDRNQPKSAQYHSKYYDLNEAVKAYPIKGKDNTEIMNDLFYNLEKGNLTKTTFTINGQDETKFVAARPIYKNLDVFDANMVSEHQNQQHRESRTLHKGNGEAEKANQQEEDSKKKGQKVRR